MKRHRFQIFIAAVAFLFSGAVFTPSAAADQAVPKTKDETGQFIAYYFHTNFRCSSCKKIEQWSHEAITKEFADQLKSGKLEWRVVNVEVPENEHFSDDFSLYTKSLVIVEQTDGKPVRWENLEKVWQLLNDQAGFSEYVTTRISAFMEKP